MKLYRENIVYPSRIVVVKEEHFPFNEFPLHYHPEYELILILKGSGKKFVGDAISEFNDGDLSFFGPNLPHTFYNKHLSSDRDIHQIVVQFYEDFLGAGFFDKRPFKLIKALFSRSVLGCSFTGNTLQAVSRKIKGLLEMDETEIIIQLLSILDILSKSSEYTLLSSIGFSNDFDPKESERMSAVYEYILHHFREDIPLSDIASQACLSPQAFCRYFKKYTRKTFSEFLIEVRIGHACRLLQERSLSISQISLDAGFNNVSYFNRKFKSITRKTPVEYQKAFTKK